jgi:hypothetical protein
MDSHKATEVRSQLGPLKDFAERTNVAVSAITHPAKSASTRPIDHFIGSQAFIAAARIGHACFEELEENEDGEKTATGRILFTNVKHSAHSKMPTLAYEIEKTVIEQIETVRVVWGEESVNISAEEAIAATRGGAKAETASNEVVDFLRTMITGNGGWCKVTEITAHAKVLGYSDKQLRIAREKLRVEVQRKGGLGKNGWWELGWDGIRF